MGIDAPAVTVATDVPVHVDLLRGDAAVPALTPFIRLVMELGPENSTNLADSVGAIRAARDATFPSLRRAAGAFSRGDNEGAVRALSDSATTTDVQSTPGIEFPVAVLLGFAFMRAYEPIGSTRLVLEARQELLEMVAAAAKVNSGRLVSEIRSFEEDRLPQHRRDVLDAAVTVLDDVEPIIAARCAEYLAGSSKVDDFRVMRDDFDVLKVRYQDAFELGSRSIVFLSRLANIALRGDPSAYAGEAKPVGFAAAAKMKAYRREPWLADYPAARRVYDAVHRRTRNNIGHRSVRYDIAQGVLSFDDGTEENYLHFLVDYLAAVRLMHYLVEMVLILWRTAETVDAAVATGKGE
jgi:hypothetical protein